MENSTKIALVALVVAIIACFLPIAHTVSGLVGGVTNYDEVDTTALRVGSGCSSGQGSASCTGSRLGGVYASACSLIASTYSVTATTSVAMDCAAPGVVSGDGVEVQFATSTASTAGPGWLVAGASASSTAGFITLRVTNLTGATAIIPASIASSTTYEAFHVLGSVPGL